MRDLTSRRLILLKAVLFVAGGVLSTAALLVERPTLRDAFLLACAIWCFARAYYFAFYVIEHYLDPGFRYSGLFSAIRHVVQAHRTE